VPAFFLGITRILALRGPVTEYRFDGALGELPKQVTPFEQDCAVLVDRFPQQIRLRQGSDTVVQVLPAVELQLRCG
jgi:hypothetical protein